MKELFIMDYVKEKKNRKTVSRPSVRGIIIQNGLIAMVHSLKYDYYKFPGGGIDEGENHRDTLIREVKEESGLSVIPDSIKEYGLVKRKEEGNKGDLFLQDNYYYLCDVKEDIGLQNLDDYESEEKFTLEWVKPETAIKVNLYHDHKEKENEFNRHMFIREAKVLEILLEEKRFE